MEHVRAWTLHEQAERPCMTYDATRRALLHASLLAHLCGYAMMALQWRGRTAAAWPGG